MEQPNSKTRRGRVGHQIANTLTTSCNQGVVIDMNELMQVGQLEGKHEQSNRIYSEDGICPTIMAGERKSCTGGYVSPKIMVKEKDINEIIRVGQISNKGSQAGMVYNSEGLFPTVCACTHGYAIGNILDNKLINKGVDNMWNNNLEKLNFEMEEIRIFDIFCRYWSITSIIKRIRSTS